MDAADSTGFRLGIRRFAIHDNRFRLMKKILFLLFTIVGVSFPTHAKSNIQKSQDYTPEKGFTIQKDLSYPLFLAMQAMKEKGLDLNNYLITYSENITGPGIIRFNFS